MTDEEAGRVRDFVGYGRNPPDPKWPGGAHVAVNFVINYEEGGELSVPDGAPASETGLTEGSTASVKGRDLGAESMFEYGSRAGFWRLHRMFTKRKLPCTVFAIARALERNPEACAAMREAGWDVAGHGYRWEIHGNMAPDYEREQIRLATESITRTIGTRPAGWYSRYAPSMHTRNLLLDNGYEYDSDTYDDELPYWLKVGARQQLIVPYSVVHNDVRFARQGMTLGRRVPRLHQERRAVRAGGGSAAHAELRPAQSHHRPSRPRAGPRPRARLAGRPAARLGHAPHRHRAPLEEGSSRAIEIHAARQAFRPCLGGGNVHTG